MAYDAAMGTRGTRAGDRDGLVAAGGAILALAVALLLAPLRDALGLTNVALLLTLVVVGAAAAGGRTAGVTTAVVAALGFNAVHLRPYGTLRIDRPEDVLTCALMVVVGLAVGQLAHLAADRGRTASSDRTGIVRITELRDMVADGAEPAAIVERARVDLVEMLGLAGCRFAPADPMAPQGAGLPPDLDPTGSMPGPLRHGVGGFELPPGGASLPVRRSDGSLLGRFVLEPAPGHGVPIADRRLAVLLADVIAPALATTPG